MSQPKPETDWMQEYLQRREQSRKQARTAIARLLKRLTKLGVTSVQLAYDGYGDSGAIEDVKVFGEGGAPIELPEDIRNAIVAAAERLLPDGWENNDGAFGELVLDVPQRRLTRQHNWRVESTEYEEEAFEL